MKAPNSSQTKKAMIQMSITFSIRNSPTTTKREECDCKDFREGVVNPECPWCHGTGYWEYEEDAWPSMNVHNGHGAALQRMLGFESEPDGEWEYEELSDVLQRAMKARNVDSLRASEVKEPSQYRGRLGARIFEGGISDEGLIRHLDTLMIIIRRAIDEEESVVFG